MPGKARVHELAKEFGVDSKTVLAKLKEQGEFVKSASSTVEAPVARRLREAFAGASCGNGAAVIGTIIVLSDSGLCIKSQTRYCGASCLLALVS